MKDKEFDTFMSELNQSLGIETFDTFKKFKSEETWPNHVNWNFTIVDGDKVVATFGLEFKENEPVYFKGLYVQPEYRKNGYATRIVHDVLKMQYVQYDGWKLWLKTDNDWKKDWYKKFGFTELEFPEGTAGWYDKKDGYVWLGI